MKNPIAHRIISYFKEWGLFALAGAFLLAVLLGTSLYFYQEIKRDLLTFVDKRLLVGAASIKYLLPPDFQDRSISPESISASEDSDNIRFLSEIVEKTGFQFLYTLIKKDNVFYITASSATQEELKKNEEVRYFTTFDEADERFHQAFAGSTPFSFTHHDRWGTFRAIAVPALSPKGRKYLLVAEDEISQINKLLQVKFIETFAFGLLVTCGALPLFFLLLRRVRRINDAQKKLEQQLLQVQKMEAIGTLAGGIAHDFNNILSGIIGYAELAQDEVPQHSLVGNHLDKVLLAGNRAKKLVTQILTFSRQSTSARKALRPKSIIKEAVKLLRSSIPSTITIVQSLDDDCGMIKADATQIHQIIMNLCTNAYHAMEDHGGVLTIGLTTVNLNKEDLVNESSLNLGEYVQLTVHDTGSGIDPQLQKLIFEPYFTTKQVGKGTGMGLAVVHGIVKNHQGFVRVNSSPSEGTTFAVYFPALPEEPQKELEPNLPIPTGNERVLFVDDEQLLADMGKQMLERLGYTVTAVAGSAEALALIQSRKAQFDLVITDQTMPVMTGIELAQEILAVYPEMPIILCTGYSSGVSREKVLSLGMKDFVLKPFVTRDIAFLIRKVLDAEKMGGEEAGGAV
nr:response regulator [uncultured Desulfobulbus sp.]